MKYFVKVFGCQQNTADAERISTMLSEQGMKPSHSYADAHYVVIVTCMVRQSAENRAYGLIRNLAKIKEKKLKAKKQFKIIVTGCLTGLAVHDKTGTYLKRLQKLLPEVDEFLPLEEIGFEHKPLRNDLIHAWVPISNGCNNYCSYCVVPFTRGKEISRPYEEIVAECRELKKKGYESITLLGQNVNSYGSDLLLHLKHEFRNSKQMLNPNDKNSKQNGLEHLNFEYSKLFRDSNFEIRISEFKPVFVKHLGRLRIPTLFPHLLEDIAKMGFKTVSFMSSNPWDFSDELIDVIARNKNISRTIHLPVQSGDDNVLKRMNRWYTQDEYLQLVKRLKSKVQNLILTTDIIVGFCGETDEEFQHTVDLCNKVGFKQVFIGVYSKRPYTYATKNLKDDVPHIIKDKRWRIIENLINKPNLNKST